MSERDVALSGGEGFLVDDELALGIPVVGFDDDTPIVGFGDDDDTAGALIVAGSAPAVAAIAAGRPALGERLAGGLHAAAAIGRQLGAELVAFVRFGLLRSTVAARRPAAAVFLAVALLASVGAGLWLRSWLGAHRVAPKPVVAAPIALPARGKSVLVARQEIPRGRLLQPTDLVWRPWPADRIRPTYLLADRHKITDFYGLVARAPIAQGDPIDTDEVASFHDHGFLSAVLRPGMRAVTVAINPQTAAGGLIMPGDYVDIMFTMPIPTVGYRSGAETSDFRFTSQTLLRHIKVLAIDRRLDARAGTAILGSAATLEVTPKQAEMITLADFVAIENGKLALLLDSLTPSGSEEADPGASSSQTVDTDISKLLPKREVSTTASNIRPPELVVLHGREPQQAAASAPPVTAEVVNTAPAGGVGGITVVRRSKAFAVRGSGLGG